MQRPASPCLFSVGLRSFSSPTGFFPQWYDHADFFEDDGLVLDGATAPPRLPLFGFTTSSAFLISPHFSLPPFLLFDTSLPARLPPLNGCGDVLSSFLFKILPFSLSFAVVEKRRPRVFLLFLCPSLEEV